MKNTESPAPTSSKSQTTGSFLDSTGKLLVVFFDCSQICCVGGFRCRKQTQMFVLVIGHNLSSPFPSGLMKSYPFESGCGWFRSTTVAHVLAVGGQPQVVQSVVVANPVDVSNLLLWQLAIYHQPDQPMGFAPLTQNCNLNITMPVNAATDTEAGVPTQLDLPDQSPGVRVICEMLQEQIPIHHLTIRSRYQPALAKDSEPPLWRSRQMYLSALPLQ